MARTCSCIFLIAGMYFPACKSESKPTMYRFDSKYVREPMYASCDEETIAAFEKALSTKLPDDFRAFLLQHNGVRFKGWPAFPLLDARVGDYWQDYGTIESLYGLAPERDVNDLLENQSSYEFNERVPGNIIAIGRPSSSHAKICISVSGADRGTVFIWSPALPYEEENKPSYDDLYPAARSFTEFWESLYPNPEPLFRGDD